MSDGSAPASSPQKTSSAAPDPLIGRVINERFQIVALIARGGMGKVYRAQQAPLGRTCAVKILNPRYSGEQDPEFHKRFFLEASIASKLTHPNTVTIFDYGRTDDDIYFMAMEYLEGKTLHRCIRESAPFTEERATHIARQICRSLREAHALGVIHRDLKPANVFLVEHADEHDFVKVLDFGLVKHVSDARGEELTQAGLFMGSPKYMAPEQIRGDKVDGRADIYALGVILYEMITGKVPFDRPNSVNIMMAHVNEAPPPLRLAHPGVQVSDQFEQLVLRCLEKNPDNRFASMEQLLGELKAVGTGVSTATITGVLPAGALAAGASTGPQPLLAPLSSSYSSQSGPVLQGAVSEAPAPAKRSNLLITAALSLAILASGIGAGVFLATRSSSTPSAPSGQPLPPEPSATEPLTAAASALSVEVPPAPATSASVSPPQVVRLDSDPAGATVVDHQGQPICSATPCQFERSAGPDQPEQLRLVFSKRGFVTHTATLGPDDTELSVKLVAIKTGPPVKRPPPTNVPPIQPPPGFKEVPY